VVGPSAASAAERSGAEQMDGGLVRAHDSVVGTAVAARGVFNGVGRIVEAQQTSCDVRHPPLTEVDTISGTGTLMF
jgi:hypothetical protein